ncbi:MAG: cytidine deaminase [Vicingaceae bacterium]
MIHRKEFSIEFKEIDSLNELNKIDQELVYAALEAAKTAYAPYSKFNVGSAVLLENGETVIGSNQENSAYPSGLCAERVTLFSASALYPGVSFKTLAIFAQEQLEGDDQLSPCGACRQVMSEYEIKQTQDLRVLLMNANGKIWEFSSCRDLLPFAFKFKGLKKQD